MPGFSGADHIDNAGQRRFRGSPGHLNFEASGAVNRTGKDLVRRFDFVGIVSRFAAIFHRRLIGRGAFARNGSLIDAAFALDDEPVGGNTLVRANDYNVAWFQFVDGYFRFPPVPANERLLRRKIGER